MHWMRIHVPVIVSYCCYHASLYLRDAPTPYTSSPAYVDALRVLAGRCCFGFCSKLNPWPLLASLLLASPFRASRVCGTPGWYFPIP